MAGYIGPQVAQAISLGIGRILIHATELLLDSCTCARSHHAHEHRLNAMEL